ncbi:MAG: ATP-binding protein [Peptoniphilaceae bacterium]|nr:ATP-binding protein [Peptoniphilaceae bacterium]MDD7383427.1 ATP-binding protein [Peptoniphilaceae bacterium]MDY3738822.1 ATP-binding protein [Peptoniphilaceae bacterium]
MIKKIKNYILAVFLTAFFVLIIILQIIGVKKDNKNNMNYLEKSMNFLLFQEKNQNFIEILSDFDKENKDVSIIYKNSKNIIYSSTDKIKEENEQYKYILTKKNKNILTLRLKNNLFGTYNFINYFIIALIFIISYFFCSYLINKFLNKILSYFNILAENQNKITDFEIDYRLKEIKKPLKKINETTNFLNKKIENLEGKDEFMWEIVKNMNEGLLVVDNDLFIKFKNPAIDNIFNKDTNEIKSLYGLLNDQKFYEKVKDCILHKKNIQFDMKIGKKDIKVYFEPSNFGEYKNVVLILFLDNSENKKLEIMRREFTSNVTHELKSPLTSINGYAEMIENGFVKENDIKKFASIIHKEGNRLLNMINDILKLSKLDESIEKVDRKVCNIKEIIEIIIEKDQKIINDKNIEVINNIPNLKISTVESLFNDLLSNLFENAIKYNKPKGKIVLDFFEDEYINISIKDTGIGIEKDKLDRIFERFYTVDKSRASAYNSTGLGLSIVKHIIDYLNYRIEVKSQINVGSTFIISIPKKDFISNN